MIVMLRGFMALICACVANLIYAQQTSQWSAPNSIQWTGVSRTSGIPDAGEHMSIAWLPAEQLAGKWVRVTATADKNTDFQIWFHLFEGRWPFARPLPSYCKTQQQKTECIAEGWVPGSVPQLKVRAAFFYPDGSPVQLSNLVVEQADGLQVNAENNKRLDDLISKLRSLYFKSVEVDWNQLRELVTPGLPSPQDIDPIPHLAALIVARLPDGRHSFVYPARNDASGIGSHKPSLPGCRKISQLSAIIQLPETSDNEKFDDAYVNAAHRCLQTPEIRHWIVDLRHNQGGNANVQIAALAALFGPGVSMNYVNGLREIMPVRVKHDGIYIDRVLNFRKQLTWNLRLQTAKVTALIGSGCASSCEALAIALSSRPNTRLIGQTTSGYASANESFPLSPRYSLALTSGYMADKYGKVSYPNVHPDIATNDDVIARVYLQSK